MFKLDESNELSPEEMRAVNKLKREIDEYLGESDRGGGKIYFPLSPWFLRLNVNVRTNVQKKIIEIYEDWTAVKFEYDKGVKYVTFK